MSNENGYFDNELYRFADSIEADMEGESTQGRTYIASTDLDIPESWTMEISGLTLSLKFTDMRTDDNLGVSMLISETTTTSGKS
jgi:hypothetical protein